MVANLTRQLGELTANRPNNEIVQPNDETVQQNRPELAPNRSELVPNRPELVPAPIVERERSFSPVLNRERKRMLSPMSRNFKKTLHVNYIFLKFIFLFIILTDLFIIFT
jgi:hypothetical protein